MNNPREIIIAIDTMGGDHGPIAVINGAFQVLQKIPKIKFIFFGNKIEIAPLLKKKKFLIFLRFFILIK